MTILDQMMKKKEGFKLFAKGQKTLLTTEPDITVLLGGYMLHLNIVRILWYSGRTELQVRQASLVHLWTYVHTQMQ